MLLILREVHCAGEYVFSDIKHATVRKTENMLVDCAGILLSHDKGSHAR